MSVLVPNYPPPPIPKPPDLLTSQSVITVTAATPPVISTTAPPPFVPPLVAALERLEAEHHQAQAVPPPETSSFISNTTGRKTLFATPAQPQAVQGVPSRRWEALWWCLKTDCGQSNFAPRRTAGTAGMPGTTSLTQRSGASSTSLRMLSS